MRIVFAAILLAVCCVPTVRAQIANTHEPPNSDVLTPAQWKRVDDAVDRGLAWLASRQQPDGSIPTFPTGQPAVTSFAVMAFLSRGHSPGEGPYGATIDRAIDYVLAQQREDGLLYSLGTEMPCEPHQGSTTAVYNHAISGLMLGETFGTTNGKRNEKLRPAIENAIDFARRLQKRPSPYARDKFGWRYYQYLNKPDQGEADLSVTSWFVMFFRSAKNAEFDIPQEYVGDAVRFVRQCYLSERECFVYGPMGRDIRPSRAMNGAGILCLTMTGNYDEKIANHAGRWIIDRPFKEYNNSTGHDRFHYGAYYCSQAMFMLGGEYWKMFYPELAGSLTLNQSPAGYWQPERASNDKVFGNCYTTALAILALTPPYQMLPIYQR